MAEPIRSIAQYFLLGRSGLRVSPLCLGTMTFGTAWGWGADDSTSRALLDRYLEVGGNFVDTADMYTDGHSEELLGKLLDGRRDRVVLATKYSFNMRPGDPNAGGNGRKNLLRALDGSLKRLQTDYVDLYWMHAWDQLTPAEEVVATMEALIRQGKIRHYAFSDVPAWYLGRAQAIAEVRGWERPIALQLEYSLVERFIEREHVPAALDLGLSVCPWSPLAEGLLTGKYTRNSGEGRLRKVRAQERLTERNFRIVDTLLAVAKEVGRSPAQVAINWITRRPGVTSTILGATRLEQLEDNLRALEFDLPPELSRRLEEVSAPERPRLYTFFTPEFAARLSGGAPVSAEPPWFRP